LLFNEEELVKLTEIEMWGGFRVLSGTDRSQAATMVLSPGQSTGGPNNRHPQSDQWLFVTSGRGRAMVGGEERDLAEGSLLLIEAGEAHEISNDGEDPLETLSFYAPPVY
jgi:mannose-6-phosphate isomerase-like protein (cupin superfamily)